MNLLKKKFTYTAGDSINWGMTALKSNLVQLNIDQPTEPVISMSRVYTLRLLLSRNIHCRTVHNGLK